MRLNNYRHLRYVWKGVMACGAALACAWITWPAFGQNGASASAASAASASQQASLIMKGPIRITMDEAIQLALQHNHTLLAARTAIEQSKDLETTANFRPNPVLYADWEYLPLGSPAKQNPDVYSGVSTSSYLQNNSAGDIGLSYLIERGKKRQARYQAAKDQTAVTTSLVFDNERQLTCAVADLLDPGPHLIFFHLAGSSAPSV